VRRRVDADLNGLPPGRILATLRSDAGAVDGRSMQQRDVDQHLHAMLREPVSAYLERSGAARRDLVPPDLLAEYPAP
jgi:hypothetical protein